MKLLTAAVVAGLAGLASAQTIQSVGVLPGGSRSDVLALSADGTSATGYSNIAGGQLMAFRWTAGGGIEPLGFLPTGIRSLGFAISGDGSVVTGMAIVVGSGHVFHWTPGAGMEDLGTIPIQNVSYGYAISTDGLVIGGGPSSGGPGHALLWSNDAGLMDLVVLPGAPVGARSSLYGLSTDGSFGAGFSGTNEGERAIRWVASTNTMENLGVLQGGSASEATATNSNGSVIAGTSETATALHAFRWTNTSGMLDLGVAPGHGESQATAISADGSVIVGLDEFGATLWTPTLGMVDLRSYLVGRGVNVTGWTLTGCYGVSTDKTALAGTGVFNGSQRGWVVRGLDPITSNCALDLTSTSDPNDPEYGIPDGLLDASDFFFFLDQFAADNLFVTDVSGSSDPADPAYGVPDGVVDASDFFTFLDTFVLACD